MDPLVPGLLCHLLDPPTWASCHMAISDDHREEGSLRPGVVVGHLVCHVFEGAVGVGAFAEVCNPTETPDEALPGCKLAEDHLLLGEVQASYGPGDLDLAQVLFISQLLSKDLGELLDVFHQYSRWGLLQGDALRGVDDEKQLDGAVNYLSWRRGH